MKRGPGVSLIPSDQQGVELVQSLKIGDDIGASLTKARNAKFHRKFFALLNLCFGYFEPPKREWQGVEAVKNFDVFREQITILAGYFDVTYNLDGSIKVKAKSISFAKMDDIEFSKLYNDVFTVLWNKVMRNIKGFTEAEMENVVNQMLSYG